MLRLSPYPPCDGNCSQAWSFYPRTLSSQLETPNHMVLDPRDGRTLLAAAKAP